jgi:hypothetical protein
MNVRIGRFISVPGNEAQLAPNNYIFSHSILYFVDPFTDTGAIASIKLSDQWLVQAGITDGHDVAPLDQSRATIRHTLRELHNAHCQ